MSKNIAKKKYEIAQEFGLTPRQEKLGDKQQNTMKKKNKFTLKNIRIKEL